MVDETTPEVGAAVSRETLAKMSKPELSGFANQFYGLNLKPDQYPKEEMIDFIINATRKFKGNAEIRVVKANTNVEVPDGYVKIRVSPGEHNPKKRPIIVGLNFAMASIPVNKDIVLPGKWMVCLEDAVERKYSVGEDDYGNETLDWTDQHKYPFSILVDNR